MSHQAVSLGQYRAAVPSGRATSKDDDVVVTAHGAVVHLGFHGSVLGISSPLPLRRPKTRVQVFV